MLIDIGSVRAKAIKGELEIDSIQPIDGDILGRIQNNPWATEDLVELIDKLLALDGLEIPLLTDFLTVARLLTGDANIDFLTYDVPDLDVDLSVNLADIGLDAILPDYGLESVLELAIGLSSNLYFAYDDYGLNLWREELCEDLAALAEVDPVDDHPKNELLLLEGFYLHDLDDQGRDVNELGASFGVDIGLEANAIVAKARMTGGVQSDNDAKIDFVDSDDDGILRYGEIAPLFSGDLSVLDVSGEIEAFLNTMVQVGVDAGLFEVMESILDIDIATYKLWDVEYALGKIGLQGFASQSALQAGKVFFDANFNGIIDDGEPVSLSYQDGGFSLSIARSLFDRNRNGRIDNEEGRLVILDAVDTSTGLPQETPLFALVDSMMITPLTSLIQKLVQFGVDPVMASNRIRHVFGLSVEIDLASYNPSSALSLGDIGAMQVYVSHVIVQSSISVLSQFVAGLMQQSPAEVADKVIDAIAQCLYYEQEASFQNPDFLARLFDAVVIEASASFNQTQLQQLSAIFSRILTVGSQLITSTAEQSTPDDVVSDLKPLKIGLQHDLGNILRQLGSGLLSPSFVDRSLDAWQARMQDSSDSSNLESLILALQSLGIPRKDTLQQVSVTLSLPEGFDRFPSDASPFRLHLQTQDNALSLLFQLGGQVLQAAGLSDPREASWLISRATAQTCFNRERVDLADADLIRQILDAAARSADLKLDADIKLRKANRISALIHSLVRLNLESSNLDQALDKQRQILGQALGFVSPYHQPGPQIIAYDHKELAYFLEAEDTQIQFSALHVSGPYELGLSTTDGRSIVLLKDLPGSDDSALVMPFEAISLGLMSDSESRFYGSIASAPDGLLAFMDEGLELYLNIDGRRYSSLSPNDLVITGRPGGVVSLAFMDVDEMIAEFSIQAPVLLTPGLDAGQKVLVDLEIARSASYDNTIGIYRVDDITGAIEFADRSVMPGDPDYGRLAVERARAEDLIFDSPTNMSVEQHVFSLSAASGFGLFLIADNTAENYLAQNGDEIKAYFSYGSANYDGSQRVASLGNGFYGFEDGVDQDFNDALLRFSISDV